MRVRAIKTGYYEHKRWKEGEIFDMKDNVFMPKDESGQPFLIKGKPLTSSWVEPVDSAEVYNKKKKSEPVKTVSNDSEVI